MSAVTTTYGEIVPGGGDTATGRNLTRRLDLIERLAGPVAGKRVLDGGCGSGLYTEALVERGADAVGIEFDEDAVSRGIERGLSDERIRAGDLEHLDLPDASVDLAIFNEVLEHVPNDLAALREARRVLRPGAAVVVLSPNRFYPFEQHSCTIKRSGRVIPYTVPGVPYVPLPLGRRIFRYHARNYWPWELRRLVRDAGFEVLGSDYLWQSFEGAGHDGPKRWVMRIAGALRAVARTLERVPIVRCFGISHVVHAVRPPDAAGS